MTKKSTDIIELYSYCIFLNLNSNLINYTILNPNINFFKGMIYIILINLITKFSIKYSALDIIFHKYWKNNLKSIVMPQILYSGGLIIMNDVVKEYEYLNNIYIKILMTIGINYFIRNSYVNELYDSLIFRYNYSIIYFFMTCFL